MNAAIFGELRRSWRQASDIRSAHPHRLHRHRHLHLGCRLPRRERGRLLRRRRHGLVL